jgi:primosomal protein N' (replication factor Y) (superfamily II helicase)
VAQVAVDVQLAHLDRPFDYAVPDDLAEQVRPGCRVRVRFAGQLVDGFVLGLTDRTAHQGKLAPLAKVVSSEPVLTDDVVLLARAVADRWEGTLPDVLRLAIPPRRAAAEKREPAVRPAPPSPPDPAGFARYATGPALLAAVAEGRPARAVWTALPGEDWPARLAELCQATLSGGRGSLVVVPDGRDLDRLTAAVE